MTIDARKMSVIHISSINGQWFAVRNAYGVTYSGLTSEMGIHDLAEVSEKLGLTGSEIGILCAMIVAQNPRDIAAKNAGIVDYIRA